MVKKSSTKHGKEPATASVLDASEVSAPIINKLTSESKDDVAWAAAAISNLVQQPESFKVLLDNNVIGQLSSSITSHPVEVQVELVGALRNIALYGGAELCKEMYRKDVLVGLKDMLTVEMTYAVIDGTVQETQKAQLLEASSLGEQVFHLLALIAESHTKAFAEVEKFPMIIEILIGSLSNADKFPLQFVASVGQLLLVMTESSKPFLMFFRSNKEVVAELVSIANGSRFAEMREWKNRTINVPVICAGILYNIKTVYASKNTKVELKGLLDSVQAVAVECCALDLVEVVTSGIKAAAKRNGSESELANEDKHIEECEGIMETLLVALELLTNVFCDDSRADERKPFRPQPDSKHMNEDGENDDDFYGSDQDVNEEETADITMGDDSEMSEGEESEEDSEGDNAFDMMQGDNGFESDEQMEITASTSSIDALLSNLVKFAELNPNSPLPAYSKNIVSLLYSMKACSFGAIGNLIDKCSPIWVKANCAQLWQWTFKQAVTASQSEIIFDNETALDKAYITDLTENIVTVLWTLIRRISRIDASIIPSNEQSVSAFIATAKNKTASEAIRAKSIHILSHLGKHQGQIEINKLIGTVLMEVLLDHSTSVVLLAETLNALFDIYCDENFDYDCVFRDSGYTAVIRSVSASVKQRVKALDKRKFRAIRDQADEAVTNMVAFIAYKENAYKK